MVNTGRPPGHDTPTAMSRRCSGCGSQPRTVTDVHDLDVLWLVAGLGDAPAPARFCGGCRPSGPITDHACTLCGDGPLLAGRFADVDDLITSAAVVEWLAQSGWRGDGQWCPDCAPMMQRQRRGTAPAPRASGQR